MAEEGVRVEADLGNPKTFYVTVLGILRAIENEQSQAGHSPWTRPNDTVGDQCGYLNTFAGTPADVFLIAFRVFENLVQCLIRDEPVQDHEPILLSVLAMGLSQALKTSSANCQTLMETLANASRLPRWRKPFGAAVQRPYKHDPMPKPEQPPDSVLLVALDVVGVKSVSAADDVLRNALRLVNNCCQEDDENRQIVLNNHGVSHIMSLAYHQVEPDFVVPALYNICVDHEPATEQLIHWKESSPRITAGSRVEDDFLETLPSEGALQVLLRLADVLCYKERKSLLADLLELTSQSVGQDLDRLPAGYADDGGLDNWRIDILRQLIIGPGFRLAASDTECRQAVCNTLINLLSHDIFRKGLIAGDLVHQFLRMPYPDPPESSQVEPELDEDPEEEANLLHCQKGVLKTLYSICALPEFASAYPLDTTLVRLCLNSVRQLRLANVKGNGELPSLSCAFVILTSLAQSEQIARSLVEEHRIHECLPELLHVIDDQDILYPAINLIGRLGLSASNKPTLVEHGLLGEMQRFFANDTTPTVQREAVIAVRRLITGSPHTLAVITATNPARAVDLAAQDSELAAALALFGRTDDASLKLEMGRLAIEVCRLLWASADGRPEEVEADFNSTVGSCGQTFVEAIAFVILHGDHPGVCGEGWFGFAMVSIWTVGRELINNCLSRQDMLAEVRKVVASGSGPCYQNLQLVLAKMNAVPKTAVFPETQSVLENCAKQMGLARIWPE